MILNPAEPDPHPGPPDSDLERVARLGNAILEGQYSLGATNGLESTFRICLCGNHHQMPDNIGDIP